MRETIKDHELVRLSSQIVAAHLAHNKVSAETVPEIIRSVYAALSKAGSPMLDVAQLEPAVAIKKSVFPAYIICLEDGKKLKMLKRHLQTRYGMTPDDYRAKWRLPVDYPMVAPDYAAHRSTLAKGIGLGRKRSEANVPEEIMVQKIPAGVRGKKQSLKKAAPQDEDIAPSR